MKILTIDPGFRNLGWFLAEVVTDGTFLVLNVHGSGADDVIEENATRISDYSTAVENWVLLNFNEKTLAEITNIEIEHGFFNFNSMNSWLTYRLSIMESTLYNYFKFKCPWIKINMLNANVYKRYFGIATGNYAKNKKAAEIKSKELWNQMFQVDVIDLTENTAEFARDVAFAWWIGTDLKANHKADCFLMLIYTLKQKYSENKFIIEQ